MTNRVTIPPQLIFAAAMGSAAMAGAAMAFGVRPGLAVTLGACYAPLVLLNLQLAIVLWLPSVSLVAVAALGPGPNLAGAMIALAWLGTLASQRSSVRSALARNGRLLLTMAALVFWMLLSTAWAEQPRVGSDVFVGWLIAGGIVLVVSTTLNERRYVRLAVGAFVVGMIISVVIGLGGAVEAETGRATGGVGDPNGLAAGIVPAVVLAAGLAAGSPRLLVRLAALSAIAVLTVGFATTESRGGFVGAVVAAAAVIVLAKRHRAWAVALVLCVVGIAAAWFSVDTAAWERLSDFNSSTGRTDLWGVAGQMWQDNPVAGVGLEGFVDNAGGYVRELGPLEAAAFVVEQPRVVHNTYLELLAETGVPGLLLFLGVAWASVRAGLRAATMFDEDRDPPMAALSRAVVAGLVGMLAAAFFISDTNDRRLWVIMALGPALLACASRMRDSIAEEPAMEAAVPPRPRFRALPGAPEVAQG